MELLNPKPIPQSNPYSWGEHYNYLYLPYYTLLLSTTQPLRIYAEKKSISKPPLEISTWTFGGYDQMAPI